MGPGSVWRARSSRSLECFSNVSIVRSRIPKPRNMSCIFQNEKTEKKPRKIKEAKNRIPKISLLRIISSG